MRTWLVAGITALTVFVGVVLLLVAANPAPTMPADPAGAFAATAPFVVKLHARWCPVCMVTKNEWADVQQAYTGRVRFAVFDFTSDESPTRSRAEAVRLGLSAVFDDYAGETGTVLVLDGATKDVRNALHGNRSTAEYRAAIDAELARTRVE